LGDVVFTYEATLHRYAIIPDGFRGCLGRRVALIRPDPSLTDSRYLLYFFLSHGWRKVVEGNIISGATVDRIPLERFPSFPAAIPSLPVQREIASILSTYDDLIENNRRRMALLEDSARLLYREWFVRLRFPGHEHTRIIDGVPEGWKIKTIGQILDFHIGGGWGRDESQGIETEEGYVIRGTDIPEVERGNFEAVGLRFHDPKKLPQRLLRTGDIIFEVSGGSATQAIGRTLLVTEELLRVFSPRVICASFCKVFRVSNPLMPYLLNRFIRHIRESGELAVYQKQSASALQNFQFQAFLDGQRIVLPPPRLLRNFCEMQQLLVRQQNNFAIQNQKLRAARDFLLPRLMSSEIAV
ncbi:MAG: restriction endonuclease subunit S, partial [Candidatus Competibacteraceae bacterium]|nr:restriction endonuclease subunit S [Candidatus Competibacteraceae bacterium]